MYINISIQNLFRSLNKYEKYFSYYKQISTNKNLEIETSYSNYDVFKFELDCSPIGKDHAGFGLDINILCWQFSFRIYDSRHWDYSNWCWEEI